VAVSFDLFGTLVRADRPDEPWDAVAATLATRGVAVPADWEAAYRSTHRSVERGAELSLVVHTRAALASRGVDADRETVREALLAAFDGPVSVRDGAEEALEAAAAAGPVGILSNCSLPGLVEQTLSRAAIPVTFDAVVTSVGCGWRKPHDRAFEAVAGRLGVPVSELVHVGDDPRADGGGRTAGATVVLTDEVALSAFPGWLEEHGWR
jgi:FMN phosphatase YigB (HAD superfamily)